MLTPELLRPLAVGGEAAAVLSYTKEQYALHIERLRHLERQYENLCVRFRNDVAGNTVLYAAVLGLAEIDELAAVLHRMSRRGGSCILWKLWSVLPVCPTGAGASLIDDYDFGTVKLVFLANRGEVCPAFNICGYIVTVAVVG